MWRCWTCDSGIAGDDLFTDRCEVRRRRYAVVTLRNCSAAELRCGEKVAVREEQQWPSLGRSGGCPPVGRTNGRRWGEPMAAVIGGQISAGGAGEPRWQYAIVKEPCCQLLEAAMPAIAGRWSVLVPFPSHCSSGLRGCLVLTVVDASNRPRRRRRISRRTFRGPRVYG